MKLSEIKSALDIGKKIEALDIVVKPYLSITEKIMMINGYDSKNIHYNGIIDESIEIKNNFASINYFLKDMSIKTNIINWYTDIEIDKIENTTPYDVIIFYKLWDFIKNNIDEDEYKNITNFIDNTISEKIKSINTLEAIIANGLYKIIEKLPTDKQIKQLSKNLIKDVNSISWEKVPMIKQIFETIQNKKD